MSPPTTEPDVTQAVRRAQAGDADAFEIVYRTHAGRVYALCFRMTADPAAAGELTQDVFVRAWENIESFRGESAFGTWLHRLTVNVVLNERKTEGRQRSRFEDDDAGGAIDHLPGRPHAPGDRMDLEMAINKLPKGAKRVFTLHDVEGYKHEEIADMLGVTTGATKAQLHRARMLLREALTR